MYTFNLSNIFDLMRFIGLLIRKHFVHVHRVFWLDEKTLKYMQNNDYTDVELTVKRKGGEIVRVKLNPELEEILHLNSASERKIAKIEHIVVAFSDIISHLISRFGALYSIMHRRIADRNRIKFKRWTDDVSHQLSLLFGLCNTSSGNIYEAFFGTSFVRIH